MSSLWEQPLSTGTPGTFKSPIGTASERLLIIWLACLCLAILLVPLPFEWGLEPVMSVRGLLLYALDETYLVAVPVIILLATFLCITGPTLSALFRAIEAPDAPELRGDSDWWGLAKRLAESANLVEREHFLIGFHAEVGYPILVPRKLFCHAQISGPTGRGKTAIGVAQMLLQQIMRGDAPIVVVDHKGDSALFHQLREAAKNTGRPFRFFTNELGLSTHVFNPFEELNVVSVGQKSQTFMEALRLNYGDKYGAKFFSSQNQEFLYDIFERYPDVESFEHAYAKTSREFFDRDIDRDRVKESITILKQLASIKALNWTRNSGQSPEVLANAIFMPRVLEGNEIIYFWLPSVGESSTVREVSSLAIYSLLTACKSYKRKYGVAKQVFVYIDEFQAMASAAFELLLQQARSYGLHAIVSNQTLSDLKKNSPTLLNSLINNTGFRMHFSPADPDMENYMIDQSGDAMYWEYLNVPWTFKVGKRQGRNDLKAVTSKPLSALIQIPFDSGYACFGGHWFAAQTVHHISKEVYDEFERRPWPAQTAETIVANQPPRKPSIATHEPAKLLKREKPSPVQLSIPNDASSNPWRQRLLDIHGLRSQQLRAPKEGDDQCAT